MTMADDSRLVRSREGPSPRSGALLLISSRVTAIVLWAALTAGCRTTPPRSIVAQPQSGSAEQLPVGALARLGDQRLRHSDTVRALLLSRGGKRLYTGDEEGIVRVWRLADGRLLRGWRHRSKPIQRLSWSDKGALQVLGGGKVQLEVGDSDKAASRRTTKLAKAIGSSGDPVAVSPDGTVIAVGSHFEVWSVATARRIITLHEKTDGSAGAFAFSPDGKTLAVGGDRGAIQLWNYRRRGAPQTLGKHQDNIGALAFSADGRRLAVGANDDRISLWDVRARRRIATMKPGKGEHYGAVAISDDGRTIAAASSHVVIWRPEAKKHRLLPVASRALALSADGMLLAVAKGQAVRLYETATGKRVDRRQGPEGAIDHLAFSPDGKLLATGCTDETVQVWDLTSKRLRHTLRHQLLTPLRVRRVGNDPVAFASTTRLISGGADGAARLWDGRKLLRHLRIYSPAEQSKVPKNARVVALAVDRARGRLYSLADQELVISRLTDGKRLAAIKFAGGDTMALSADRRRLALGGAFDAHVYDVSTDGQPKKLRSFQLDLPEPEYDAAGEVVTPSPPCRGMMAFAEGPYLVTAGLGEGLCLWDWRRGKLVKQLHAHGSWVRALAVSPDGRLIASGAEKGPVKLWRLRAKLPSALKAATVIEPVKTLPGHEGAVMGLTFSPDGRVLASGGADGMVTLWRAAE